MENAGFVCFNSVLLFRNGPKMVRIYTSPKTTEMIHLVPRWNRSPVCPVGEAVKHLSSVGPLFSEVSVSVEFMRNTDHAPITEGHEP